ncbi:protein DPCD [Anopheles nili]|uniref:protein DPCD n=1 Tax=Anopheles nili TaxID=185578 RepID=UPI00237AE48D|nr:protein DPCD [Anopheles nili]
MAFTNWLGLIKNAKKSSVLHGNVRKIYYQFADGREMAEEYSTETGVVLRRAWKKKSAIIQKDDWITELGEPISMGLNENDCILKESSSEPLLSKRLTRNSIEWRIRNLPYPLSTYTVTCEPDKTILVRTSNKKYYKKIHVEEFLRCNFVPRQEDLTVRHNNATLVITYKKPTILLEMERSVLLILQDIETMEYDNFKCEDLINELSMQ